MIHGLFCWCFELGCVHIHCLSSFFSTAQGLSVFQHVGEETVCRGRRRRTREENAYPCCVNHFSIVSGVLVISENVLIDDFALWQILCFNHSSFWSNKLNCLCLKNPVRSILWVGFLTLLLSELNLLSLSLCTISRYLNSEAIFLPLPCSPSLLHCIQSEDEEQGGHRWREVLCLFLCLLSEWMSPQMGLYWEGNTNLQSNEKHFRGTRPCQAHS